MSVLGGTGRRDKQTNGHSRNTQLYRVISLYDSTSSSLQIDVKEEKIK